MPSTYTQNLLLEKPATGEQAGIWGETANSDYNYIDTGIDGNLHIPLASSGYNLNTAQQADSQGRYKVIVWTGALTQTATVNITPNTVQKLYLMTNATTGGFAIIFQQGTGGVFTLQAGRSAVIYADGTGTNARVDGALYNAQLGSVLVQTNLRTPVLFLDLPNSAPYDMYYRGTLGDTVRLPIGTAGQALMVGGAGPQWSTAQSIGGPIAGSVANCVLFVNAAGQMAQDGNFRWNGVGLAIGNTSFLGPLTVSGRPGVNPDIFIDSADSAAWKRLIYSTAGVARAEMRTTGAADDLILATWNDAAAETTHVTLVRNNGHTTIGGYADLGGRFNVLNTGDPASWVMVVRGAAGQAGYLTGWQNSAGTPMAYVSATGVLAAASDITSGGTVSATGNVTAAVDMSAGRNLGVGGSVNIGGQYLINGVPLRGQTPWASDIDGASHSLLNCAAVRGPNNVLQLSVANGPQLAADESLVFCAEPSSVGASYDLVIHVRHNFTNLRFVLTPS